jgi:hypothetical protein
MNPLLANKTETAWRNNQEGTDQRDWEKVINPKKN